MYIQLGKMHTAGLSYIKKIIQEGTLLEQKVYYI